MIDFVEGDGLNPKDDFIKVLFFFIKVVSDHQSDEFSLKHD